MGVNGLRDERLSESVSEGPAAGPVPALPSARAAAEGSGAEPARSRRARGPIKFAFNAMAMVRK